MKTVTERPRFSISRRPVLVVFEHGWLEVTANERHDFRPLHPLFDWDSFRSAVFAPLLMVCECCPVRESEVLAPRNARELPSPGTPVCSACSASYVCSRFVLSVDALRLETCSTVLLSLYGVRLE